MPRWELAALVLLPLITSGAPRGRVGPGRSVRPIGHDRLPVPGSGATPVRLLGGPLDRDRHGGTGGGSQRGHPGFGRVRHPRTLDGAGRRGRQESQRLRSDLGTLDPVLGGGRGTRTPHQRRAAGLLHGALGPAHRTPGRGARPDHLDSHAGRRGAAAVGGVGGRRVHLEDGVRRPLPAFLSARGGNGPARLDGPRAGGERPSNRILVRFRARPEERAASRSPCHWP